MQTVIVVGAGASKPFGLPTAPELLHDVVSQTPSERTLGHTGPGVAEQIRQFIDRLKHCGLASIDQFTAHNTGYLDWGRRMIAAKLLPKELSALSNRPASGDWHRWVFQKLVRNNRLDCSDVAFVIFNYDRLLELSLSIMAASGLGQPFRQVVTTLEQHVFHVYGKLTCPAAEQLTSRLCGGNSSAICNDHSVSAAYGGISLMPLQRTPTAPSDPIAQRVLAADRVIFMGFSFDSENLHRIGAHRSNPEWTKRFREVFASGFGMLEAERLRAKSELGHPILFGGSEQSCLEVLRDKVIW